MEGYIHTAAASVPVLRTCPSCVTQVGCFLWHLMFFAFFFFYKVLVLHLLHICSITVQLSDKKSCGFYRLSLWDSSLSIWPDKHGGGLRLAASGEITISIPEKTKLDRKYQN